MKILAATVLMAALAACYGERILFLGAVGSKSHKMGYMPIAEALAARGHQVAVVNPFPTVHSSKLVREITVPDIISGVQVDWFDMQKESLVGLVQQQLKLFSTVAIGGYELLKSNEEFQRIVQERAVDLIVIDCIGNDFALPFVDQLGVPFVFYSPTSAIHMTLDIMSIPKDYASVPAGVIKAQSNMGFFQRMGNMLSTEMFVSLRHSYLIPMIDKHAKQDFPNARPIAEIERDASLCLMNHHLATAYPRSLPPNVIPIGGLHVRPAKLLPQDLRELADESSDGFIVFTLGSFISGSSLPAELLDVFLKVFEKLPQRIFWKWETSDSAKFPSNVVLLDWLPQQDLIGHSNCRLFISHGGLLGIQEAIYHQVPLLGLPFGNDQHNNMERATSERYAIQIEWDKLNEQNLFEAIDSLLNNQSYRDNAVRVSRLMRDEMVPGRDMAAYWIEHVLRTGGAAHLQLASKKLSFVQKNLIDVWLFIGGIVGAVAIVLWSASKICLRLLKTSIKVKVN